MTDGKDPPSPPKGDQDPPPPLKEEEGTDPEDLGPRPIGETPPVETVTTDDVSKDSTVSSGSEISSGTTGNSTKSEHEAYVPKRRRHKRNEVKRRKNEARAIRRAEARSILMADEVKRIESKPNTQVPDLKDVGVDPIIEADANVPERDDPPAGNPEHDSPPTEHPQGNQDEATRQRGLVDRYHGVLKFNPAQWTPLTFLRKKRSELGSLIEDQMSAYNAGNPRRDLPIPRNLENAALNQDDEDDVPPLIPDTNRDPGSPRNDDTGSQNVKQADREATNRVFWTSISSVLKAAVPPGQWTDKAEAIVMQIYDALRLYSVHDVIAADKGDLDEVDDIIDDILKNDPSISTYVGTGDNADPRRLALIQMIAHSAAIFKDVWSQYIHDDPESYRSPEILYMISMNCGDIFKAACLSRNITVHGKPISLWDSNRVPPPPPPGIPSEALDETHGFRYVSFTRHHQTLLDGRLVVPMREESILALYNGYPITIDGHPVDPLSPLDFPDIPPPMVSSHFGGRWIPMINELGVQKHQWYTYTYPVIELPDGASHDISHWHGRTLPNGIVLSLKEKNGRIYAYSLPESGVPWNAKRRAFWIAVESPNNLVARKDEPASREVEPTIPSDIMKQAVDILRGALPSGQQATRQQILIVARHLMGRLETGNANTKPDESNTEEPTGDDSGGDNASRSRTLTNMFAGAMSSVFQRHPKGVSWGDFASRNTQLDNRGTPQSRNTSQGQNTPTDRGTTRDPAFTFTPPGSSPRPDDSNRWPLQYGPAGNHSMIHPATVVPQGTPAGSTGPTMKDGILVWPSNIDSGVNVSRQSSPFTPNTRRSTSTQSFTKPTPHPGGPINGQERYDYHSRFDWGKAYYEDDPSVDSPYHGGSGMYRPKKDLQPPDPAAPHGPFDPQYPHGPIRQSGTPFQETTEFHLRPDIKMFEPINHIKNFQQWWDKTCALLAAVGCFQILDQNFKPRHQSEYYNFNRMKAFVYLALVNSILYYQGKKIVARYKDTMNGHRAFWSLRIHFTQSPTARLSLEQDMDMITSMRIGNSYPKSLVDALLMFSTAVENYNERQPLKDQQISDPRAKQILERAVSDHERLNQVRAQLVIHTEMQGIEADFQHYFNLLIATAAVIDEANGRKQQRRSGFHTELSQSPSMDITELETSTGDMVPYHPDPAPRQVANTELIRLINAASTTETARIPDEIWRDLPDAARKHWAQIAPADRAAILNAINNTSPGTTTPRNSTANSSARGRPRPRRANVAETTATETPDDTEDEVEAPVAPHDNSSEQPSDTGRRVGYHVQFAPRQVSMHMRANAAERDDTNTPTDPHPGDVRRLLARPTALLDSGASPGIQAPTTRPVVSDTTVPSVTTDPTVSMPSTPNMAAHQATAGQPDKAAWDAAAQAEIDRLVECGYTVTDTASGSEPVATHFHFQMKKNPMGLPISAKQRLVQIAETDKENSASRPSRPALPSSAPVGGYDAEEHSDFAEALSEALLPNTGTQQVMADVRSAYHINTEDEWEPATELAWGSIFDVDESDSESEDTDF